jgi:thiol-disulfide isomerase/thioredoxin
MCRVRFQTLGGILGVIAFSCAFAYAQTKRPLRQKPLAQTPAISVTQLDDAGLLKTLKPNAKPLLVNFWATWCDPCREEFPDLVKLDAEYKNRIDFITVTLDEPKDIKTTVPKFLSEMKATMPAYLLVSADESELIPKIAKDWTGGMPFTVLYGPSGEIAYFRQGKVQMDVLKTELDKLVGTGSAAK